MSHPDAARLQAYLSGAADPVDSAIIEEHLTQCPGCADQLALLAADDAFLTHTLAMSSEEQAWIYSLDLTDSVQRQLAPRGVSGQALLIAALLLFAAGWLYGQITGLLGQAIAEVGPVGLTVQVARSLALGLWQLLVYILSGGLLPQLWPALALGAGLWLLRRHLKGVNRYA